MVLGPILETPTNFQTSMCKFHRSLSDWNLSLHNSFWAPRHILTSHYQCRQFSAWKPYSSRAVTVVNHIVWRSAAVPACSSKYTTEYCSCMARVDQSHSTTTVTAVILLIRVMWPLYTSCVITVEMHLEKGVLSLDLETAYVNECLILIVVCCRTFLNAHKILFFYHNYW